MVLGVIFDLDGTLADTLVDITASVNHALQSDGSRRYTPAQVQAWVGDGIRDLLVRASGCDDPEMIAARIDRFRQHARLHCLDHTRLYPGWADALGRLRLLETPMAVLSNKPHELTRRICNALVEHGTIRHVEGHMEPHPKKPDPARALAICEILVRRPCDTLFVGDSENDVRMAAMAGIRFVGVAWGFRSVPDLRSWGAQTILDHPSELIPLVEGRE